MSYLTGAPNMIAALALAIVVLRGDSPRKRKSLRYTGMRYVPSCRLITIVIVYRYAPGVGAPIACELQNPILRLQLPAIIINC